jgi:hypothetical protein
MAIPGGADHEPWPPAVLGLQNLANLQSIWYGAARLVRENYGTPG